MRKLNERRAPPFHSPIRSKRARIIHWGSFEATHDDVTRWRREGRGDILKHLAITSDELNDQSGTFASESCSFLKKSENENIYHCTIHDTKPLYCKGYPDDDICEYMTDHG